MKSNFSRAKTDEIRKKLNKKEVVYNSLKEKEQKDSLANKENNIINYISRYFKNFKKDLEKFKKYQYNITYGLNYLFNEEEDYYEPTEIKSAFDDTYMLYESRGDNDAKLSLEDYFNIIRPYLKDNIENHNTRGEWKIQLSVIINFISSLDTNESRSMHTK